MEIVPAVLDRLRATCLSYGFSVAMPLYWQLDEKNPMHAVIFDTNGAAILALTVEGNRYCVIPINATICSS